MMRSWFGGSPGCSMRRVTHSCVSTSWLLSRVTTPWGWVQRLIAGWEEGYPWFDPENERVPDCAVRNLRLCVEDVVSREGSDCDWRVDALDEDEMVEASKGGEWRAFGGFGEDRGRMVGCQKC